MTKRNQAKAAALPTIEPQKPSPVEAVQIVESDSTTVGGVTWVDIRVPVFTGDLGKANVPDRVDAKLIGRKAKEAVKRLTLGLEMEGVKLEDGKHCTGTARDAAIYVFEQVASAKPIVG